MSGSEFALLPCNGLDKSLGQITRAAALNACTALPELELLCPMVCSQDPGRYKESAEKKKLIVIDGCGTRCATKTAAALQAGIALKLYVPDVVKSTGSRPEASLEPGPGGLKVAGEISRLIMSHCSEKKSEKATEAGIEDWNRRELDFLEAMVDKFVLKVPKEGYLFNENDCWAFVRGSTALIGISDYLQTRAGDIMYVGHPDPGKEISQFDEAGDFESSKSVLQVISPVSGVVVRINEALKEHPELLNEDPYRRGWIAELRLTQLEEDRELLLESEAYFKNMIDKAQREIAGRH
ncbi:MAG: putative zinc-binding protein [Candidatus Eremiobacteraeota bacterium]|nr:putative zinc-binding protein [Candidatus Eremiobacteraeota bacterium]